MVEQLMLFGIDCGYFLPEVVAEVKKKIETSPHFAPQQRKLTQIFAYCEVFEAWKKSSLWLIDRIHQI